MPSIGELEGFHARRLRTGVPLLINLLLSIAVCLERGLPASAGNVSADKKRIQSQDSFSFIVSFHHSLTPQDSSINRLQHVLQIFFILHSHGC
jgi:hypothetical protein